MIRDGRQYMHKFIAINHGDASAKSTHKRKCSLFSVDAGILAGVGVEGRTRQDELADSMPALVSQLVYDLRVVAERCMLRRESGAALRIEDAADMQDLVVRCTAVSFMLCHVRPSLVEDACVYLTVERPPSCCKCKRDTCSNTVFLVHPVKDELVLVAPHHKAAKGKGDAEPITMRSDHHWLVVLFREWAVWGQSLMYGGEVPDYAGVMMKHRLPSGVSERPLLMRAPVKGGHAGVYRRLQSGDATFLLRRATGTVYMHKDYRHAFITVLQGMSLPPGQRARLMEAVSARGGLPDWINAQTAKCLGNSLSMWRSTYDHGKCPVDARTTEVVLGFMRRHLLVLAALGRPYGAEVNDEESALDPEAVAVGGAAHADAVDWINEWGARAIGTGGKCTRRDRDSAGLRGRGGRVGGGRTGVGRGAPRGNSTGAGVGKRARDVISSSSSDTDSSGTTTSDDTSGDA